MVAGFAAASCLAVQRAVAGGQLPGTTVSERILGYSGVFGSVALDASVGFCCFLVYALTAGAETAITTLWPWKVRELAQREADEGTSGMWSALRRDLQRFLQTILIGATISSVLGVALVTEVSGALLGPSGLMAATVSLTVWQLVMCEIVPKSVAVSHALPFCRAILPPVYRLSAVIYPAGKYINRFVELLLGWVGISADTSKAPLVSEEELDLILSSAVKSGVVERAEGEMMVNVRNLDNKRVKEVMTALVDMTCISSAAQVSELQRVWLETKFSRIPVYQGRVDRIVGVVSSDALLRHLCRAGAPDAALEAGTTVEQICDKALFVPETMSLHRALEVLKGQKIAICVDELGGTAGLVTLEDVMEEIVGEVYDPDKEKDVLERRELSSMIECVDAGRYTMSGAAEVEDVAERLAISMPKGDYRTIGGFVADALDRLPLVGEAVLLTTTRGSVRLEVTSADDRKVLKLDVTEETSSGGAAGEGGPPGTGDDGDSWARILRIEAEALESGGEGGEGGGGGEGGERS